MSGKASLVGLKVLAVLSAVALGGGYVVWKGTQAKNIRIEPLEAELPGAREEAEKGTIPLIIGSKSPGSQTITIEEIQGILDQESAANPTVTAPNQPPLLPGPKSIGGDLFLESDVQRALEGNGEKGEDRPIQVLPGSKSLAPIFRQRQEQKP